jgi:hypothetical protein
MMYFLKVAAPYLTVFISITDPTMVAEGIFDFRDLVFVSSLEAVHPVESV